MESKTYIIKKLEELKNLVENIEIKYEYRTSTNTHIIEINPISVFKNDNLYIQFEEDIQDEFESLFPFEEILFISEESLTKIRNVEFELLNETFREFELLNEYILGFNSTKNDEFELLNKYLFDFADFEKNNEPILECVTNNIDFSYSTDTNNEEETIALAA